MPNQPFRFCGFYVLPVSCCSLDQLHRHLLKRWESVRRKILTFRFTRSFSVSQPRPTRHPQWFDCPRSGPLERTDQEWGPAGD